MITREQLPTQILVDSLYSKVCPACGDRKGAEKSLCYSCYGALPPNFKRALYNRVGHGYAEAMLEALNFLEAEKVHMPTVEAD
jgi:hypothetical protein